MTPLALTVATQIRTLRLRARITQAELAAGAGCTVETVARIERVVRNRQSANANPSLETLERIATALGVDVIDLLRGKRGGGISESQARRTLAEVRRVLEVR